MSWRARIAKALAAGQPVRTDLSTPGYHGTGNVFIGFENQPISKTHMIDTALGTHVGKDPLLASGFADRFINQTPRSPADYQVRMEKTPNVIPLAIPGEDKFLQAVQPRYEGREKAKPEWRHVLTDQRAIEIMAAQKAYQQNPELLERYLMEARMQPAKEAIGNARAMVRGDRVPMEGREYNLEELTRNFGGMPYNAADKQAMVDTARDAWSKEGYKGIRYINTAPLEAGAFGVKDPTSYVVFDPKNIRSQFAKFDPAKMDSNDLLAGIAGATAVPVGMGVAFDQSAYEAAP
jgi:hypothetical protein